MTENGRYYVVAEEILPDGIVKTAKVKEMLSRKEAASIPEAAERVGIARSTFYKYRDGVHSFSDLRSMRIVNMLLTLEHAPGVLGGVLGEIAAFQGNVLTINQVLPMHGAALVTVTVALEHAVGSADDLMRRLEALFGVIGVQILGTN